MFEAQTCWTRSYGTSWTFLNNTSFILVLYAVNLNDKQLVALALKLYVQLILLETGNIYEPNLLWLCEYNYYLHRLESTTFHH